ncbi:MAG: PKD domain-containing protein, partial [Sphingobacteriales bacterium]
MKRILLALLLMAGFAASAQSYLMNNNNPVTTCAGVFTDSGNTTGPYGNSQNFTKTFTPATAGSAIRFEFTSFQLEDQADLLQIFDGPDVSAPLIGGYSGTTIPPLIMPTAANTSGAITFRFTSDGVVTNPGWVANVTCVTPCQLIQSVLTSTVPAAAADGVIKVCPGTPVTFNGDGTFSSSGAGATYVWDVEGEEFTGQSFTYTFANSGAFRVNLRITDANGCTNINLINQVVQVSVPPVATFNADVDEICNGNQLSVDAIIAPVPFNYECTPPVSGTTFLPDGSGQSYTSIITVDCFQSNQQITSANQLINVCLNMEHSYLGDLNIVLTSPNGSTVVLKAYPGGGGTWLGTAIDDDSNLNPGVGAQYCLSMSGTSTMVNGPTQPVLDPVLNNTGDQLVPGTYLPIGNFSAFVGSPLNGSWTITVTDNLGIDNGYIFEWGLEFDPALVPGDLSFANTIVSQGWLPDPAIVSQVGDTITVSPETSGTHCFTYAVTDDFGCVTEFVKCIEVLPALPLNDPQDLFRCEGQTFDLTEVIPTILGSQNAAAYNFAFHHTALDAQYIANQIITPETYTGLDGEIIYVSIEDLLSGSNCIEVREFTLHLTEKPEPSIEALPGIICQDQPLNAVLTGSLAELPYTFEYNINGGATQTISTVGTDLSVPVPLPTNVAGPVTITITRITDNTGCFNDTPVSATTEVLSLPESDIVLDTANPCAAEVTFQGLNGTAPYEFTFTLGTGAAESVSTVAGSDSVTFTVPSGTSGTLPVTIINVSDANCSNVQNVTESITFGTLPEATITPNTTSICQGSTPLQVTFAGSLGTAPYQFTYVINGGTPQVTDSNNPVITLDTSLATTFQIDLLEVSDAN